MTVLIHELTKGSLVTVKSPSLEQVTFTVDKLFFHYVNNDVIVVGHGLTEKDQQTYHVSHITKVEHNPNGVYDWVFTPVGFLCSLYPKHPLNGFIKRGYLISPYRVLKVLENKYGHRLSWKDKLYDVYKIASYVNSLVERNELKTKKKIDKRIIAVSSKYLIKRSEVSNEYNKESKVFYEDDLFYDYD